MFETVALSSGPLSRGMWSTCGGIAGEALLLAAAVLVPILSPQVLPRAFFTTILAAPGAPPPPPAPGPLVQPRGTRTALRTVVPWLVAPAVIPKTTPVISDEPETFTASGVPGGIVGGETGGAGNGSLASILSATPAAVKPVPRVETAASVPAAAPPSAIPRVRAGGHITPGEPIYRPEPQYPALARQMRISGTVELEGVIGTDGHLNELRVLRGHPLLARAALDAVSRWIYRPTLLNGDPVEVIAPITVTFHMN